MEEKKVNGCDDCPFCTWHEYDSSFYCSHPSFPEEKVIIDYESKMFPSWCPLKTEPITIILEQK